MNNETGKRDMVQAMPAKSWKKRAIWFLREWVRPIVAIVVVACTFRSAIADWNDVPTGSMKPTILEGDRILVNKLAYDLKLPFTRIRLAEWGEPERGDIVVFFSPDRDIRMVKRVVGVPGDVIAMRENQLFINGRRAAYFPPDEDIVDQIEEAEQLRHRFAMEVVGESRHPVMLTPGMGMRRSFAPITVPEGHFFAMGDNRDNSRDSRWFGFVARDMIVGRSSRVALSLDPDHWRLPRWSRFLRPLD